MPSPPIKNCELHAETCKAKKSKHFNDVFVNTGGGKTIYSHMLMPGKTFFLLSNKFNFQFSSSTDQKPAVKVDWQL